MSLPALWLPVEFKHQAELAGATVVDRASVVTTHLAEIARDTPAVCSGAKT
jgi:flagellar biosynthesis protein FlhA